MKRSSDKEALNIFEPARFSQMEEGSSHIHRIMVAAFKEPDEPVILISFKEFGSFVITCAAEIHEAVNTAAD